MILSDSFGIIQAQRIPWMKTKRSLIIFIYCFSLAFQFYGIQYRRQMRAFSWNEQAHFNLTFIESVRAIHQHCTILFSSTLRSCSTFHLNLIRLCEHESRILEREICTVCILTALLKFRWRKCINYRAVSFIHTTNRDRRSCCKSGQRTLHSFESLRWNGKYPHYNFLFTHLLPMMAANKMKLCLLVHRLQSTLASSFCLLFGWYAISPI